MEDDMQIVQQSSPSGKKKRIRRFQLLLGGAVLLSILLYAGAGYWFWYTYMDKDLQTGKNIDATRVDPALKALQEASAPAAEGNLGQSIEDFDRLISNTRNISEKSGLYRAKAGVCASQEDYRCAIEANNQSLAISEDQIEPLIMNGDWSYILGDSTQGNEYYQRAIVILRREPNNPFAQETISNLQRIIDDSAQRSVQQ